MLLLLLSTHNEQYAMDSQCIVEVVPFLHLQSIPTTPAYIPGAINYNRTPIPVVDISQLFDNKRSRKRLSTRIILVKLHFETIGTSKTIGLLAEKVTETVLTPKGWRPHVAGDTPYFIDSSVIGKEMIQWFDPQIMLPQDLAKHLFSEEQWAQDIF